MHIEPASKDNENITTMMSFESGQFKELDNLRTHPGRVTRKDASMEGTVRPMILVLADIMAVGRHSLYSPFLNPQLHERRPSPQSFNRQNESFQAAYHGSAFTRYLQPRMGLHSGMVARHPFIDLKKSSFYGTSIYIPLTQIKDRNKIIFIEAALN